MAKPALARIAASLLIANHLLVIVLYPNQGFYLTERLAGWLRPYASLLGVNSTWIFFAPHPGSPIYFEYELDLPGGGRGVFPAPGPYAFRQMHDRRIAFALGSQNGHVRDMLRGWICRQAPGARRMSLRLVTVPPPSIEEVEAGFRLNDLTRRRTLSTEELACP
ncbi:MAG TPA: hypothetical protein VFM29_07935 [Vicinamibacteria bacterium]|nr:hypothetical protein [Vicinamibacteria bacterium]